MRGAKDYLAIDWPDFNSFHSFCAMMLVVAAVALTATLGDRPDYRNDWLHSGAVA